MISEGSPAIQISSQGGDATQTLRLVLRTRRILRSEPFARLRAAAREGRAAEERVRGLALIFEPDLPAYRQGMTLKGERGLVLGPGAFAGPDEPARTVLQELYRLETAHPSGETDRVSAREDSAGARAFTARAFRLGRRLRLL